MFGMFEKSSKFKSDKLQTRKVLENDESSKIITLYSTTLK